MVSDLDVSFRAPAPEAEQARARLLGSGSWPPKKRSTMLFRMLVSQLRPTRAAFAAGDADANGAGRSDDVPVA